jgi:terminase large subunit-like protein
MAAAIEETYTAYGNISHVFTCTLPELILGGPAGTGKSRGMLEYLNYWAMEYPGCRLLLARKTRRSLTESGMVTLEQRVLHPAQGVRFVSSKQQYQYPNGSIIAVGGLDKPSKIMSSEWDIIYCQEATELSEDDWESCSIRLRNGRLPVQQIIGDCNPGPSSHWIKQRSSSGNTLLLETRHEDNPTLFTRDGIMTPEGERYLSKLDRLTGVRYLRYRKGLWVSAEGMVYQDSWNPALNIIDRFPIPRDWPRYLIVDFGYIHPFVCLWAARDPDGRLYIYRQVYKTRTLVEDHAQTIALASGWCHLLPKTHPRYRDRPNSDADPLPREIICDHDAEDRATLERHLGLFTTPAKKTVSDGIQAVASRLRPAGDGKPRLMIMRDGLVERDHDLAEGKQPTCVEDEPESYVWDTRQGMKKGEQPMKEGDDGMDCLRYLCAHLDLQPNSVSYFNDIWK